jgi:hypothetical protein
MRESWGYWQDELKFRSLDHRLHILSHCPRMPAISGKIRKSNDLLASTQRTFTECLPCALCSRARGMGVDHPKASKPPGFRDSPARRR